MRVYVPLSFCLSLLIHGLIIWNDSLYFFFFNNRHSESNIDLGVALHCFILCMDCFIPKKII